MNKEELKEIKNIIKYNSDYKEHYHLHADFEVEYIDNLVKCYEKQKKQLEEKEKVIDEAFDIVEKVYNDAVVNTKIWTIDYFELQKIKKILERGKNG